MEFDGIDGFDLDGLSDKEIFDIYNEVIDNGLGNDCQLLVSAVGNGSSYSK